jgi:hypothetical protein
MSTIPQTYEASLENGSSRNSILRPQPVDSQHRMKRGKWRSVWRICAAVIRP